METCDGAPLRDPALEAALALELPPSAEATVAVRACGDGVWVLVREDYPPRHLALGGLVPRLRRRAVALLAAELLEAEALSSPPAATPDPLRLQRGPEAARGLLLQVLVQAEPTPPKPWRELELAAAGRLFLGVAATPVAGATARLTLWGRLELGLEGLGTAAGGLGLLQPGVRLLALAPAPGWRLEVGLRAEVGLAVTRGPGATGVDWLAGGAARAAVGLTVAPGWELWLALSTGYLLGGPLGGADATGNASGVAEPFLGLELGARRRW